MRERGSIILAFVFIILLVFVGIYFMQQIHIEESNTNRRSITGNEVPTQAVKLPVQ